MTSAVVRTNLFIPDFSLFLPLRPTGVSRFAPSGDLLFHAKHLFVAAKGWQNRAKHCQAGHRPLLHVGLALDPRRSWGPWPSADRATVRDARSSFASGGPFLIDSAPGLGGLFIAFALTDE
jgi:hypothetical protein